MPCASVASLSDSLREVFNSLRYIVKTGASWRWMANDRPPWAAAYPQAPRWLAAGCFEALVDDLRAVLRLAAGRAAEPTAAIIHGIKLEVVKLPEAKRGCACIMMKQATAIAPGS